MENGENMVDLGHEIENDEWDGVVTTRLVDRRIQNPFSNSKLTSKVTSKNLFWR